MDKDAFKRIFEQYYPPKPQFFNNTLKKPIINFDDNSKTKLNIQPTNANKENIQKKIAEDKSKKVENKPITSAKTENKIDTSASDENASKFKQFINNRNSTTNNTNGTLSGSSTGNGASSTNGTTMGGGSGEAPAVKRKQATTSSSSDGSISGDNGVLKKPEDGSKAIADADKSINYINNELHGGGEQNNNQQSGQSNNQQSGQSEQQNQQVQQQVNEQPAPTTQQETPPQNVEQSGGQPTQSEEQEGPDYLGTAWNKAKDITSGNVQNLQAEAEEKGLKNAEKLNKAAKPEEDIGNGNWYEQSETQQEYQKEKDRMEGLQLQIDRDIKNGWGIQKYAALGGAVFGAISKYKKDLERWEYECQRAAAEGRPMPKKPSLAGSMLVGAATGGAMGAGVGFLAKHNPLTGDIAKTADKSLKTLGRNKSIQKFEEKHGKGVLQEVETYKNMTEDAKRSRVNANIRKSYEQADKTLSKYAKTLSKGGKLNREQYDYMNKLRRSNVGIEYLKKYFPDMNEKWWNDLAYNSGVTGFFSNVAYVSKCFSIMEVYKNSAIGDVERFRELYNFYTLHMNEEPMDVYTFLRECFDYPSFARYIEQAMQRFIQEELITFSDLIDGYASDTLSNYKVLYKNYQRICGTTLDPQEFLERCIYYPSYVEYITKKVKRTQLLKMGLQSFAEVSSTSLPQNVQVNGENIDTTEEGLPDAKNYESMKNQNSLQTKEQQAKARQAQLQKQREAQKKQQQIEANKANYAKAQQAKMQDKITKLSQQKAAISKNLGRNSADMQVGQLAQEKQKVTDLNLKIQAVKADTKNKIANYKGTGGKNFSLKKPCII